MASTPRLLIAFAFALSGCVTTDAERGFIDAAGGAVIADATGDDALTGAVIGGAADVLCDNMGVWR